MSIQLRALVKGTIFAIAGAVVVMSFAVPRAQNVGVTGPSAWVSFTADMIRTTGGGVTYGRLYRGADGSSRLETGLTPVEMTFFDIKNVTQESTYYFSRETGWKKHPMKLDGRGVPLQTRPSRIAQQTGRSLRYETLGALSVTQPDGTLEIHVPALNFFVVDSSKSNGTRIRYLNIQVGPVDMAVFEPPPDAVITYSAEPAGIIRRSPEEVQQILEATKKNGPQGRQ
jgi:hypothetical protein